MLILPSPATACSCIGDFPTVVEETTSGDGPDVAFVGVLTARTPAEMSAGDDAEDPAGPTTWTGSLLEFEVEAVFLGTVPAVAVLATPPDGGACGLPTSVSGRLAVIGFRSTDGQLNTDLCSAALATATNEAALATAFGEPTDPSPVEEDTVTVEFETEEVVVGDGISRTTVLILGLVLGLGIAILRATLGRRRT